MNRKLLAALAAFFYAQTHAAGTPLFTEEVPLSEAHTVLSQGDMLRITDSVEAARAKQIRVVKLSRAALGANLVTADGIDYKAETPKQCTPDTCTWIGYSNTGMRLLFGLGKAGDAGGNIFHEDGTVTRIGNYADSKATTLMRLELLKPNGVIHY